MDFIDKLKNLADKIEKLKDSIDTEEGIKTAFVMPFINALGYDVFDPAEVIPEFTADVGIKKGEKVDYAILKDNKPIILIECKRSNKLSETHASQLFRYFSVTEAKVGILTNGVDYKFFSDLEENNKMDNKPFLEISLLNINETIASEIKKFSKDSFNLNEFVDSATKLKYTKEIKEILNKELYSPSEEFVKFFASKIYDRRLTQQAKEQFTNLVKIATKEYINSKINERLQSAIENEDIVNDLSTKETTEEKPQELSVKDRINTTTEELEGYHIVKSILRKHVEPHRIAYRDTLSYFGILLDDNNRKPICRLHFNYSTKYLELFDSNKNGNKVVLNSLDEIYQYEDQLKETLKLYGETI